MFAATRRWFNRNRKPLAITAGVIGAGYVVTHYVLNKLNDARERMSSDRIAKENLRRRFQQNQEDCTYTVLALLPSATAQILEAMNTEKITLDIQQMKTKSQISMSKSIGSISPPSISETNATTDDDGRSIVSQSVQSESGVHASQISVPTPLTTTESGDGAAPAAEGVSPQPRPQQEKAARKTKRQLWDDLTISCEFCYSVEHVYILVLTSHQIAITRAYTLLYTLGLLTMLTRIQLNLLGRRTYLSSVVSLATGGAQNTINLENRDDNDDSGSPDDDDEAVYGSDFALNRKYLTFSWWLLNRGWVDVMQRVETAVRQVYGSLSPRDSITFDTFCSLSHDVRKLVEGGGGTRTQWLPFLLPPPDMEDFVLRESGVLDDVSPESSTSSLASSSSLRSLLDETSDLIESPAFSNVLTQILDEGFSLLLDKKLAAGAFDTPTMQTQTQPTQTSVIATSAAPSIELVPGHLTNRAVLLPKILSVLTRQAHVIGQGAPEHYNEYLQAMEAVRDLEGFAAVVCSSNWQAEIARGEGQEDIQNSQSQNRRQGTRQQMSGGGMSVDPSIVVVDPKEAAGFDSAWERAFGQQEQQEQQQR